MIILVTTTTIIIIIIILLPVTGTASQQLRVQGGPVK